MADFADLEGCHIKSVTGLEVGSDEVRFELDDGTVYEMSHHQDCCEAVSIAEIVGDVPTEWSDCWCFRAEESSRDATSDEAGESGTWTFYRMDTSKGCFVIRWLGQSNGYYSESVDFERIADTGPIVTNVPG